MRETTTSGVVVIGSTTYCPDTIHGRLFKSELGADGTYVPLWTFFLVCFA